MTRLELRLATQQHGYIPIPCKGKQPVLSGWQNKTAASVEEMSAWPGLNTGMLTKPVSVFDADITVEAAAEGVEDLARRLYSDLGKILVRFGQSPKRAIPFRTAVPFPKMVVNFIDPHGNSQKIEFLGDGQQLVVHGTHPDTQAAYAWHGDQAPWNTPRDELPEITEQDARDLLELAAELLEEDFGFKRVGTNGDGHDATEKNAAEPLNVAELLAGMRPGATHDAKLKGTASLLRRGLSVYEAVQTVIDEGRQAMADDAGRDWDAERLELEGMCFDFVKKHPELADSLPDKFRDKFVQDAAAGREPWFVYNKVWGWQVRAKQGTGGADDRPAGPGHNSSAADPVPPPRVTLRWFSPVAEKDLPPRCFVYGKHYQRKQVGATVAPGGTGKTSLNMVEAVAMATGRNLLGEQPEERYRVWLHNGEDSTDELDRRVVAICRHYNIPQEDLAGWLAVTSGAEMPLKVAKGFNDLHIDAPLVREITGRILEFEIDVVMFDPLVTLHSVNENDNGKMDTVIRIFTAMAGHCDCSIDISHHTRKTPAGGGGDRSADDSRGAVAVRDAVRAMRILNPMSLDEARGLGLDEFDRLSYFRVDRGKANMVKPAAQATWRRFESVLLSNGDDVGVVTPWETPEQGKHTPEMAAAERRAENAFIALLVRFTMEGRKVSASKGMNYAPTIFADEREAKAQKLSKRSLAGAMGRLFEAKRIRVEETGSGGKKVSRLVVVIKGAEPREED